VPKGCHKLAQEALTNSWSSNTKQKANKFINLRYSEVQHM